LLQRCGVNNQMTRTASSNETQAGEEKGEEEEEKKREQTIPHAYQCKCLPLLWRSFEDYNDTKYPGVVS